MKLKVYRTNAGLTQAALSDKSGVNLQMIQKYEQGIKDIKKASGETLLKLSKVLGCSMEDLMHD